MSAGGVEAFEGFDVVKAAEDAGFEPESRDSTNLYRSIEDSGQRVILKLLPSGMVPRIEFERQHVLGVSGGNESGSEFETLSDQTETIEKAAIGLLLEKDKLKGFRDLSGFRAPGMQAIVAHSGRVADGGRGVLVFGWGNVTGTESGLSYVGLRVGGKDAVPFLGQDWAEIAKKAKLPLTIKPVEILQSWLSKELTVRAITANSLGVRGS